MPPYAPLRPARAIALSLALLLLATLACSTFRSPEEPAPTPPRSLTPPTLTPTETPTPTLTATPTATASATAPATATAVRTATGTPTITPVRSANKFEAYLVRIN